MDVVPFEAGLADEVVSGQFSVVREKRVIVYFAEALTTGH
jgi:hypothetical protein